jgi:hypothetical protein
MKIGKDLFSPVKLGPYELRNRLVMAPLTRNRTDPGNVPQPLNALYMHSEPSSPPKMNRSKRKRRSRLRWCRCIALSGAAGTAMSSKTPLQCHNRVATLRLPCAIEETST